MTVSYEIPEQPVHFEDHEFSAEASDIGLRPDQWPDILVYEGVEFHIVAPKRDDDGDLLWVDYSSGQALFRVYNY
jgi:hypothetical protein